MITDSIKNKALYEGVHKYFKEVLEVLSSLTPDSPAGKIVIDEGNAWVNVSKIEESADKTGKDFEAHRDFIDIHYLVSGSEIFGYAYLGDLEVTVEFDPARDCLFAKGHVNELKLSSGEFIVTYPEDAHLPAMKKLSEGTTTRAIAKIRM
ncbi:MAG: YhcH/YjgK/YiaL family protein [Clostridia bacterium]|nr:YhcH/YjgK/YiaL family protein [Clostridia bacterium]